MTVAGGRRYALLLALHDSDYSKNAYGGYRNVFLDALRSDADNGNETWDCFRVIDGEFPATEDLHLYDGFVVSGSPHDAHGEASPSWVRRLCALLRAAHGMGKRVLGVCFGHQVLCRALGGAVGRAKGGWDVGVRKITFVEDEDNGDLEFLQELGLGRISSATATAASRASIIEVHQDEVWELPPGGKVLAYSEKTRVEMFAVGGNVLGIQGHPEYGTDILLNLVGRLAGQNAIDGPTAEEARSTAESGGPDREFWTGLCKAFLRGGGGRGASDDDRTMAVAEMSCSHHVFVAPSFPAGTAVGL